MMWIAFLNKPSTCQARWTGVREDARSELGCVKLTKIWHTIGTSATAKSRSSYGSATGSQLMMWAPFVPAAMNHVPPELRLSGKPILWWHPAPRW